MFGIDDAMAEIVVRSTQPALAAIKLAWWRERLQELDEGKVPAEPRLQKAANELLPRGLSGVELSELEQPWALLLRTDEQEEFMRGVGGRGPALFKLGARLLGVTEDELGDTAQSFAAADLGRRGIFDLVPLRLRKVRSRAPRRADPLMALAALARRDMRRGGPPFEAEATPGRAWTLLVYRLTGWY